MTTLWKCELCGKKIPEDEVVVVAGKDMCGGCYQENYPRRTVGERAMETLKHDPVHKDVGKSRVPGRPSAHEQAMRWLRLAVGVRGVRKWSVGAFGFDAAPGDWHVWVGPFGAGGLKFRWEHIDTKTAEGRRTARALLCAAEVYARVLDPNEESRQHILPHEGVFNEAEA